MESSKLLVECYFRTAAGDCICDILYFFQYGPTTRVWHRSQTLGVLRRDSHQTVSWDVPSKVAPREIPLGSKQMEAVCKERAPRLPIDQWIHRATCCGVDLAHSWKFFVYTPGMHCWVGALHCHAHSSLLCVRLGVRQELFSTLSYRARAIPKQQLRRRGRRPHFPSTNHRPPSSRPERKIALPALDTFCNRIGCQLSCTWR